MLRKVVEFCVYSYVLILFYSFGRVSISKCMPVPDCLKLPDGSLKTSPNDYGELMDQLRDFNLISIFNKIGVKIECISIQPINVNRVLDCIQFWLI